MRPALEYVLGNHYKTAMELQLFVSVCWWSIQFLIKFTSILPHKQKFAFYFTIITNLQFV